MIPYVATCMDIAIIGGYYLHLDFFFELEINILLGMSLTTCIFLPISLIIEL